MNFLALAGNALSAKWKPWIKPLVLKSLCFRMKKLSSLMASTVQNGCAVISERNAIICDVSLVKQRKRWKQGVAIHMYIQPVQVGFEGK